MNSNASLVVVILFFLVVACWWGHWLAIAALKKLTAVLDPRLLPAGLCPNCGYDRAGKQPDERCSECGLPYESARSMKLLTRPWIAWLPSLTGPVLFAYLYARFPTIPATVALWFLFTISVPFVVISALLHFSALTRHSRHATAIALLATLVCVALTHPASRALVASSIPNDAVDLTLISETSVLALGLATLTSWATALLAWAFRISLRS